MPPPALASMETISSNAENVVRGRRGNVAAEATEAKPIFGPVPCDREAPVVEGIDRVDELVVNGELAGADLESLRRGLAAAKAVFGDREVDGVLA